MERAADRYEIENDKSIPTPALLIYEEQVDANIRAVIAQCGDAARWRPHVKTAKSAAIMARFAAQGISRYKCATTKELRALLDLGVPDVLLAFPVVGATAARVRDLAAGHPATRVSVLAESAAHIAQFAGSRIGIFMDCNPGMDRTGGNPADAVAIAALIRAAADARCEFRGLHWYDGHLHGLALTERTAAAHRGYDVLLVLVQKLRAQGTTVPEIIVAGTPAAPCALSYPRWSAVDAAVCISPGTVVYNDMTSLGQLPPSWGLSAAALVLSSVVSHPRPGRFTCDAGHKSVSADAGVPTCEVLGHADFRPAKPSEEHLPVDCGDDRPAIGDMLYLLPRHVCPTVNNFDEALLVRGGRVAGTIPVTARGHDGL
jgi:D-serine deaminase-like pyridoxal phosphate-dependent protein